jgi:hypothetical protein
MKTRSVVLAQLEWDRRKDRHGEVSERIFANCKGVHEENVFEFIGGSGGFKLTKRLGEG